MSWIARLVAGAIGLQFLREGRRSAAEGKRARDRVLARNPDAGRGAVIWQVFRSGLAGQYRRTDPDTGQRHVGWRLWLLLWLFPVLFALAALVLALQAALDSHDLRWTTGEVVQVYAFPGETLMDRGRLNYSPVIRFTLPDGRERRLTPGMSHPDWNLAPGTTLQIGHRPDPDKVWLPGWHNWAAALVIAGLGLFLALPAGLIHWRLMRWLRAGA